MARQEEIKIKLVIDDKNVKSFENKFYKQTKTLGKKAGQETGKSFQTGFQGILKKAGGAIFGGFFSSIGGQLRKGLQSAISDGVKGFVQLDKGIREVMTLLDEEQIKSLGGMEALKNQAKDLAETFGQDIPTATKAMYDAISSGVDPAAMDKVTDAAGKLAVGGVTDVGTAINGITNLANAYKLNYNSVEDLNKITDTLFTGMKKGKTTIGELSNNLGKVAPIAAQLNVPIEQLVGGVAALTTNGLSTSQSITQMKSIMTAIVKPSKSAQEVFTKLGISFGQSAFESQNFAEWMETTKQKLDASGVGLEKVFGNVNALGGAMALTGKSAGTFNDILKEMDKNAEQSGKATADAFAKTDESVDQKMKKMQAKMQNVFINIIEKLMPVFDAILPLVDKLMPIIESISPLIGAIATAIGEVLESDFVQWIISATGAINNFLTSVINPTGHAKAKMDELYNSIQNNKQILDQLDGITINSDLIKSQDELLQKIDQINQVAPELAENMYAIATSDADLAEKIRLVNQELNEFKDTTSSITPDEMDQMVVQFTKSQKKAYNEYYNIQEKIIALEEKRKKQGGELADRDKKTLMAYQAKIKNIATDFESEFSKLMEMGISKEDIKRLMGTINTEFAKSETMRLKNPFTAMWEAASGGFQKRVGGEANAMYTLIAGAFQKEEDSQKRLEETEKTRLDLAKKYMNIMGETNFLKENQDLISKEQLKTLEQVEKLSDSEKKGLQEQLKLERDRLETQLVMLKKSKEMLLQFDPKADTSQIDKSFFLIEEKMKHLDNTVKNLSGIEIITEQDREKINKQISILENDLQKLQLEKEEMLKLDPEMDTSEIDAAIRSVKNDLSKLQNQAKVNITVETSANNENQIKGSYDKMLDYIEAAWNTTDKKIANMTKDSMESTFDDIDISYQAIMKEMERQTELSEEEKTRITEKANQDRMGKTTAALSQSGALIGSSLEFEKQMNEVISDNSKTYDQQKDIIKTTYGIESAQLQVVINKSKAALEELKTRRDILLVEKKRLKTQYALLQSQMQEISAKGFGAVFSEEALRLAASAATVKKALESISPEITDLNEDIRDIEKTQKDAEQALNDYTQSYDNALRSIKEVKTATETTTKALSDYEKQQQEITKIQYKMNAAIANEPDKKGKLQEELRFTRDLVDANERLLYYVKSNSVEYYSTVATIAQLNEKVRELNDSISELSPESDKLSDLKQAQKEYEIIRILGEKQLSELETKRYNTIEEKEKAISDQKKLNIENEIQAQQNILNILEKKFNVDISEVKTVEQFKRILSEIEDFEDSSYMTKEDMLDLYIEINGKQAELIEYKKEEKTLDDNAKERLYTEIELYELRLRAAKQILDKDLENIDSQKNYTYWLNKTLEYYRKIVAESENIGLENLTGGQLEKYNEALSRLASLLETAKDLDIDTTITIEDQTKEGSDKSDNLLVYLDNLFKSLNANKEELKVLEEQNKENQDDIAYQEKKLELQKKQSGLILSIRDVVIGLTTSLVNSAVSFGNELKSAFEDGEISLQELLDMTMGMMNGIASLMPGIAGQIVSSVIGVFGFLSQLFIEHMNKMKEEWLDTKREVYEKQIDLQEQLNNHLETQNEMLELTVSTMTDVNEQIELRIESLQEEIRLLQEINELEGSSIEDAKDKYEQVLKTIEVLNQMLDMENMSEVDRIGFIQQYKDILLEAGVISEDFYNVLSLPIQDFLTGNLSPEAFSKMLSQMGLSLSDFNEILLNSFGGLNQQDLIDIIENQIIPDYEGQRDQLKKLVDANNELSDVLEEEIRNRFRIIQLQAELADDEEGALQSQIDMIEEILSKSKELKLTDVEKLELQVELKNLYKEQNEALGEQGILLDQNVASIIDQVNEARKLGSIQLSDVINDAVDLLAGLGYNADDINDLLNTDLTPEDLGVDINNLGNYEFQPVVSSIDRNNVILQSQLSELQQQNTYLATIAGIDLQSLKMLEQNTQLSASPVTASAILSGQRMVKKINQS